MIANGVKSRIALRHTCGRYPVRNAVDAIRFRAQSALLYILYFKRVSLFDENTKKFTKPNRLMRFKLSRNLGRNNDLTK